MAENIITYKVVGESGASNSNAIGQTPTAQSKVKKERKKRSRAWDHFTSKTNSDENDRGVCNSKQEYFVDTKEHGTTTMIGRIPKCKKMSYNIDIKQSKLAFQPVIWGNKGDVAVVPWKFEQEECRKALCRMVILDELPFRFVEKDGFKQFMEVAQPCFRIPSCTTVTRDCFDLFDEEKHKMMVALRKHNKGCLQPLILELPFKESIIWSLLFIGLIKNGLCIKDLSTFFQSLVIEVKILQSLLVSVYMSGDCIGFSLLQLIMLVQIVWR